MTKRELETLMRVQHAALELVCEVNDPESGSNVYGGRAPALLDALTASLVAHRDQRMADQEAQNGA